MMKTYLIIILLSVQALTLSAQERMRSASGLPAFRDFLSFETPDFNNDGLHDVFILGINTFNKQSARLFLNRQSGFVEIIQEFPITLSAARWYDLNNDGYPDLLTESNDSITLYINLFGEKLLKSQQLPARDLQKAVIYDVSGNGFADILLPETLLTNHEGVLSTLPSPFPKLIKGQIEFIGQFEDGLEFLILGVDQNGVGYHHQGNFQQHQVDYIKELNLNPFMIKEWKIADLNANGKNELVVWQQEASIDRIFIYDIEKSGIVPVYSTQIAGIQNIFLHDFNQNGVIDLLLSGIDGGSGKELAYIHYSAIEGWRTGTTDKFSGITRFLGTSDLNDDQHGDLIFAAVDTLNTYSTDVLLSDETRFNTAPEKPVIDSVNLIDGVKIFFQQAHDRVSPDPVIRYELHLQSAENPTRIYHSRQLFEADSEELKYVISLPETGPGAFKAELVAIDPENRYSLTSDPLNFIICPVPEIELPLAVCRGDEFSAKEISGLNGIWSLKSGVILNESPVNQVNLSLEQNDTLLFSYNSLSTCPSSSEQLVLVDDTSSPLSSLKQTVCEGEVYGLDFSGFQDNFHFYSDRYNLSITNTASYHYPATATDRLIFSGITHAGCTINDSLIYQSFGLKDIPISWPESICLGESIVIDTTASTKDVSYSFEGENFTLDNNEIKPVQHAPLMLNAIFTLNNNCSIKKQLNIPVYAPSPWNHPPQFSICEHDTLTVQIPAEQVSYIDAEGSVIQSDTIRYPIKNNTLIYFNYEDQNSCRIKDTLNVQALQRPSTILPEKLQLCVGDSILFENKEDNIIHAWKYQKEDIYTSLSGNSMLPNPEAQQIFIKYLHSEGCSKEIEHSISYLLAQKIPLPPEVFHCNGDSLSLELPEQNWKQTSWITKSLKMEGRRFFLTNEQHEDTVIVISKDLNNCTVKDTINIIRAEKRLLSISGPALMCRGEKASFAANNLHPIQWSVNNRPVNSAESEILELNLHEKSWIKANSKGQTCELADSLLVYMKLPEPVLLNGRTTLCHHDTLKLSLSGLQKMDWFNTRGILLSSEANFMSLDKPDTIIWQGLDSEYCLQEGRLPISYIAPPPLDFEKDLVLCDTASFTFPELPSDLDIHWRLGTDTLAKTSLISPQSLKSWTNLPLAEFIVSATNTFGCVNTDTLRVYHELFLNKDTPLQHELCPDQTITLEASILPKAASHLIETEWFLTDENSYTGRALEVPSGLSGEIKLYARYRNCLVDSSIYTLKRHPKSKIHLNDTLYGGIFQPVELSLSGFKQISVHPFAEISPLPGGNILFSSGISRQYTFNALDSNSCPTKAHFYFSAQNQFFAPTLFSPNGDGINEYFSIHSKGLEQLSFKVFDQKGKMLFTYSGPADQGGQWDGTFQGVHQPEGLYFWEAIGRYYNGKALSEKGNLKGKVLLIR